MNTHVLGKHISKAGVKIHTNKYEESKAKSLKSKTKSKLKNSAWIKSIFKHKLINSQTLINL